MDDQVKIQNPDSKGLENEGHPVPESNLSIEENKGSPETMRIFLTGIIDSVQ